MGVGTGVLQGSLVPLLKASLVPTPTTENVSRVCQFSEADKKKKKKDWNPASKTKRNANKSASCGSRKDSRKDGF